MARVLGRLLAAAGGGIVALAGVNLLLALVDVSCEVVEHASGLSLPAALGRLGIALGVTGSVGGPQVAGIGAVLLALLAAAGALVLWLELAVRSALLVVAVAFVPLGLAGLLWPATASWLRRLAEVITAIAVSKLVIVVVLVLGAAALTSSPVSLSTPGADVDAMVSGIAFLAIATLGLPMALRLVPMATEAAIGAGLGAVLVRRGIRAPSAVSSHMSAARGLVQHVNGGGAAAAAGAGAAAGGPAAATALASTAARRAGQATGGSRGAGSSHGGAGPARSTNRGGQRGDNSGGRQ